MKPGLKYTLGRLGLFLACAVPALVLLPAVLNPLLKLMIALVVSAGLSYVALRRWRDEMTGQMSANAHRRSEQRDRLRSALAGEDAVDQAGR